jgi:hypothetical protein
MSLHDARVLARAAPDHHDQHRAQRRQRRRHRAGQPVAAARSQQKKAIVFGSVGAIVLRLVLTFFAVMLLSLPYLKLVGAALLLWIGVGLLKGDDGEGRPGRRIRT